MASRISAAKRKQIIQLNEKGASPKKIAKIVDIGTDRVLKEIKSHEDKEKILAPAREEVKRLKKEQESNELKPPEPLVVHECHKPEVKEVRYMDEMLEDPNLQIDVSIASHLRLSSKIIEKFLNRRKAITTKEYVELMEGGKRLMEMVALAKNMRSDNPEDNMVIDSIQAMFFVQMMKKLQTASPDKKQLANAITLLADN